MFGDTFCCRTTNVIRRWIKFMMNIQRLRSKRKTVTKVFDDRLYLGKRNQIVMFSPHCNQTFAISSNHNNDNSKSDDNNEDILTFTWYITNISIHSVGIEQYPFNTYRTINSHNIASDNLRKQREHILFLRT
jgi:hypothetical protein